MLVASSVAMAHLSAAFGLVEAEVIKRRVLIFHWRNMWLEGQPSNEILSASFLLGLLTSTVVAASARVSALSCLIPLGARSLSTGSRRIVYVIDPWPLIVAFGAQWHRRIRPESRRYWRYRVAFELCLPFSFSTLSIEVFAQYDGGLC